jgi:sigma-B regulation protein RsbU (phosphoserine phosphatase)
VIVRAGGTHEVLPGGGPVLGVLSSIEYRQYSVNLEPGDVLVIYSDGVTEAVDPADVEFETDRLAEVVKEHIHKPASQIITAINQALVKWTKGAPAFDDVTLIVARRLA